MTMYSEFGSQTSEVATPVYVPVAHPLKVLLLARVERTAEEFAESVDRVYADLDSEPVTLWGRTFSMFDWGIATRDADVPDWDDIQGDESGVLIVEVDTVASMNALSEQSIDALLERGASRTTADGFKTAYGLSF